MVKNIVENRRYGKKYGKNIVKYGKYGKIW